jgi:LmbE family N-acetylglucosaminyl deacetylase
MHAVTILSPHRDDAVFSLGLSLLEWRKLPLRLSIVNFFTVSSYGPRATSSDESSITRVRQAEDHRVLASIDTRIRITSLDLLDAPLRLGIPAQSVCSQEMPPAQTKVDLEALTSKLRKYFHEGLVVAPLGLGDHIDHLTVREAAIAASSGHRLGFYEDLPYATWTDGADLLKRVMGIEEASGERLKACTIRTNRAVPRKYKLAVGYNSQIDRAGAYTIARFSINYGGGERIWIPKHRRAWRTLTH